ncbi:MAG: hypothetical protein IH941_12710 [Acidobacteria bacterium]|nr:hypothetical protein [Acidobacteriota bacterium]
MPNKPKKISLAPLSFEEALEGLLAVEPPAEEIEVESNSAGEEQQEPDEANPSE